MKHSMMGNRALATVVVAAALVTIGSVGVGAAEIPDPVTDVTVTPQNPRLGERIRTEITFCVPDSTVQGDSFRVELPAELVFLPNGFPVRNPDDGMLVANATITGSPSIATFTFTDYVDTRTDVCGTAFFESFFDDTLTVGEERRLVYTVNGTFVFEPTITPRERGTGPVDDIVGKGGFFTDTSDQCRTSLDSCLEWHVRSRVGPFDQVVINDSPIPGVAFECDEITVTLRQVLANGELGALVDPASVGVTSTIQCEESVQVTVNDVPAGLIVRLIVRGTPEAPSPDGGRTFENAAVITHIVGDEIVYVDEVIVQRRSSIVGGEAAGVTPTTTTTTETTTTVAETSTTAVATTTTVAATTTTLSASGAVTTTVAPTTTVRLVPVLPATGSGNQLAPIAVLALLAGLALVTVAVRRAS